MKIANKFEVTTKFRVKDTDFNIGDCIYMTDDYEIFREDTSELGTVVESTGKKILECVKRS
jgi:hypothetical protein